MKYPDGVKALSVCLDKHCLHLQALQRWKSSVLHQLQNNGAIENLQTRMSTKNSLVFWSYVQEKAQAVADEVSQKC